MEAKAPWPEDTILHPLEEESGVEHEKVFWRTGETAVGNLGTTVPAFLKPTEKDPLGYSSKDELTLPDEAPVGKERPFMVIFVF